MATDATLKALLELLVEGLFGRLPAIVFSTLLYRGRLPSFYIHRHSRLTRHFVDNALAILVQHELVHYYSPSYDELMYYEANIANAYELVRCGKHARLIEDRFGSHAAQVVADCQFLGHARQNELVSSPVDHHVEADAVGGALVNGDIPGSGTNSGSTLEVTSKPLPQALQSLIDAGYIDQLRNIHFLSSDDFDEAVGELVKSENDTYKGLITGPKKIASFNLAVLLRKKRIRDGEHIVLDDERDSELEERQNAAKAEASAQSAVGNLDESAQEKTKGLPPVAEAAKSGRETASGLDEKAVDADHERSADVEKDAEPAQDRKRKRHPGKADAKEDASPQLATTTTSVENPESSPDHDQVHESVDASQGKKRRLDDEGVEGTADSNQPSSKKQKLGNDGVVDTSSNSAPSKKRNLEQDEAVDTVDTDSPSSKKQKLEDSELPTTVQATSKPDEETERPLVNGAADAYDRHNEEEDISDDDDDGSAFVDAESDDDIVTNASEVIPDPVSPKRRRRTTLIPSDDESSPSPSKKRKTSLERESPETTLESAQPQYRLNRAKFAVSHRTSYFAHQAARKLGSLTGKVYFAVLMELEKQIPRCFDDFDLPIDEPPSSPSTVYSSESESDSEAGSDLGFASEGEDAQPGTFEAEEQEEQEAANEDGASATEEEEEIEAHVTSNVGDLPSLTLDDIIRVLDAETKAALIDAAKRDPRSANAVSTFGNGVTTSGKNEPKIKIELSDDEDGTIKLPPSDKEPQPDSVSAKTGAVASTKGKPRNEIHIEDDDDEANAPSPGQKALQSNHSASDMSQSAKDSSKHNQPNGVIPSPASVDVKEMAVESNTTVAKPQDAFNENDEDLLRERLRIHVTQLTLNRPPFLTPVLSASLPTVAEETKATIAPTASDASKFVVQFPALTTHYIRSTVLDTVASSPVHGPLAARLLRILQKYGHQSDYELSVHSLLHQKQIRSLMTNLTTDGFVTAQEIPRDNSREPAKTIFIWGFNWDRVTRLELDSLYKTMVRLIQRKNAEALRFKRIIEKCKRTDIEGHEEEKLWPRDLKEWRQWRASEHKFLIHLDRLDELVGLFNDWAPPRIA
ncbi:MAG: RNA polymerase III subunit C82 [Chrysothrix sp. TS-e1954]|nr:MAG: RNA polymerase III subunit C82 [Chrysothrix sp. TS-e1954]